MIDIQLALTRGSTIRHGDWPPFHYAKLVKGPDGKQLLYRCYPDGHRKILDIRLSELRREDGWLVLGESPDLPPCAA